MGTADATLAIANACPPGSSAARRLDAVAEPAILADGIVKHFGDVEALCGVSFAVPPGTVLGLLGPNGAGKTTAVRILTTLLPADEGRAEVLGPRHPPRRGTGTRFDRARRTERRGRREPHGRGEPAARRSTHPSRSRRADPPNGRPARELRPARRRRPARAHVLGRDATTHRPRGALVHQPPVLFLDEPTTGLDPRSRTDLWGVIEGLVERGTTVLLTTQYLEEADRLADQIVVIDHGTVIAEGTAAELKSRLGSTVIDIGFASVETAAAGAAALASVGAVATDGSHVHVTVSTGPTAMLDTVHILDAAPAPTGRPRAARADARRRVPRAHRSRGRGTGRGRRSRREGPRPPAWRSRAEHARDDRCA